MQQISDFRFYSLVITIDSGITNYSHINIPERKIRNLGVSSPFSDYEAFFGGGGEEVEEEEEEEECTEHEKSKLAGYSSLGIMHPR